MERMIENDWDFMNCNIVYNNLDMLSEKAQEHYKATDKYFLTIYTDEKRKYFYTKEWETITRFDSKEELDKYVCNLYDEENSIIMELKDINTIKEELRPYLENNKSNTNNITIENKRDNPKQILNK